MKINRNQFLRALNVALKVIPKGEALPLLKGVLVDGPGQKIVATDLETYIEVPVEITDFEKTVGSGEPAPELPKKKAKLVELAKEHGITVTSKSTVAELTKALTDALTKTAEVTQEIFCLVGSELKRIIASLETDTIEISVAEGVRSIVNSQLVNISGHFRNLPLLDTDAHIIPEPKNPKKVASVLASDLTNVGLAATSTDEGGFRLNVVYFDSEGKNCVATDGHRLHWVPTETEKNWMLPYRIIRLIDSLITEDQVVNFDLSEDEIYATTKVGKVRITIRVPELRFPDYQAVIDKPKYKLTVKKEDVDRGLKQAVVMTDSSFRSVKLTFNHQIGIEVLNPDKGEYQRGDIPIVKGSVDPEIQVGMNAEYLLDASKNFQGDTKIQIGITDNAHPLTVKVGKFNALIMPVRLS